MNLVVVQAAAKQNTSTNPRKPERVRLSNFRGGETSARLREPHPPPATFPRAHANNPAFDCDPYSPVVYQLHPHPRTAQVTTVGFRPKL